MNHSINLDDDMSELLESLTTLTSMSNSDLIERLLSAHLSDLYELLALVSAHPELRERAGNLIVSLGPEPLEFGVKRIAPAGYKLLREQFERLAR